VDAAGNLYIADPVNYRIRKVSNGVITTVAGNGTQGFSGDNGLATSARLSSPISVALDAAGSLYMADGWFNPRICRVSNGVIISVAGGGTTGCCFVPAAMALDAAGSIYIADRTYHRILKVSAGSIITVVRIELPSRSCARRCGRGLRRRQRKPPHPQGVSKGKRPPNTSRKSILLDRMGGARQGAIMER